MTDDQRRLQAMHRRAQRAEAASLKKPAHYVRVAR